ncbi:MAG TPA: glycosyltransferase family 2 protein [Thermoleophilaceae bacterium]|nr:glycosyltransferase family 2 protein [Thermoleophilaceae bacterium]
MVVATRNRRDRVLATLDRLAELPERPQVVVVDDASQDGTAQAVARRHPHVQVVRMSGNRGASARNAGVSALETTLVAVNDDDSWWAPGALARAAAAFEGRPKLAAVQARILVGDDERLDPVCAAMRRSPLPAFRGLPGPAVLGFVACGVVFRRAAFLHAGGFHPRLELGGEETLLAFDLATHGWELAYVDSVVAYHHPAAGADRPRRRARQLRNELWTAWLRRRPAGAAGTTVRVAARAAREGQLGVLAEAAKGLPWVLAQRRPLPRSLDRAAGLVY